MQRKLKRNLANRNWEIIQVGSMCEVNPMRKFPRGRRTCSVRRLVPRLFGVLLRCRRGDLHTVDGGGAR
jgi:hypothetical protein